MKSSKRFLGIYLALFHTFISLAQSPVHAPNAGLPNLVHEEAAARDLRSALNYLTSGNIPKDANLFGTVKISGPQEAGSHRIVITCKGSRKMKVQMDLPAGKSTYVLSAGRAIMRGPTGDNFRLHAINTASETVEYLPFAILEETDDPNMGIKAVGAGVVASTPVQVYKLSSAPATGFEHFRSDGRLDPVLVSIDPATNRILKLEKAQYSENGKFRHKVEILFSDYRVVGGVSIPFTQQRFSDGRLRSTLQLESVNFNTGHADSEFELAQ